MKQLTLKLFTWIDQGLEPKMKVLVAALFLGLWGLTLFGYKAVKQQRDDANRTIEYERRRADNCEREKNDQLKSSLEYSQRQKEKQDSILNRIISLKNEKNF